jgi:hypothetical protein
LTHSRPPPLVVLKHSDAPTSYLPTVHRHYIIQNGEHSYVHHYSRAATSGGPAGGRIFAIVILEFAELARAVTQDAVSRGAEAKAAARAEAESAELVSPYCIWDAPRLHFLSRLGIHPAGMHNHQDR